MHTFALVSAESTTELNQNMDTLIHYITEAKKENATALCLPECFLTGYYPDQVESLALSRQDAPLIKLTNLATENEMDLLVGFMEKENDNYYITHGIFLANGQTYFYRKTHLGNRESTIFSAGDSLDVFTLSCGIPVGFQLCVESHFNDITQTLSLRGAQLIFAPFASPKVSGNRHQIWKKYIPARSYDNRVTIACCNLWSADKFAGCTFVTNPTGEVIASSSKDCAHMTLFTLDSEPVRHRHYFPAKRRKELYD